MSKDSITVEGVMLSEFLNKNEDVKDEIERNKEFRDSSHVVGIKQKSAKPKYKQYREDNGEVKLLNKLEISLTEYDKYMTNELKNNAYRRVSILAFMKLAYSEKMFSISDMANEVIAFAKNKGIQYDQYIEKRFKFSFIDVRKSEFGYFIKVHRKRTKENPGRVMKFSSKPGIEDLSFNEAFKLNSIIRYRTLDEAERGVQHAIPAPLPEPIEESLPELIEESVEETESTTPNSYADLINTVKKHIASNGNSEGGTITFTGDIHIHININK